jgi:serine phosphatase RsbU (regulator of sigma subunit)/ligand-binding sensor domain-containing protein
MCKLLLTILTFFSVLSVISQDYYPPIVNYSPQDYKVEKFNEDGTPYKMNPENYAIIQDDRGVMYFGNSNGVLEYDGETWDFIEVSLGSYVYSLAKDSNGVIYVGSNNDFGFLKSDSIGELKYQSLSTDLPEDDQYFSNILAIYSNKTDVYFQAQESVFIYNLKNKKVKTILPEESFHTSFLVDGQFYVRERTKGIEKWNNDTQKLELLKGTEHIFKTYGCFGIFKSNDSDSLFIITQEKGLYKYNNDSLVQIINPDNNHINPLKIFNSIKLSDNNYVLSTFSSGVYIINEKGEILKQINKRTGLRSEDVKSMFEDSEQNLWLGLGNGIAKVNYYSPLSFFNEKSGIEGDVMAFTRFEGLLYVGTSNGLFVQDTTAKRLNEFINIPTIKNQIWDFEVYNNKLYIASTEGIWDLEDNTFRKLTHFNTNKILFVPSKNVFITAGTGGLKIWTNNFQKITDFPLQLTTVLGLVQDPQELNTFWVGTAHSGAIRVRDTSEYEIDQYDELDGLQPDLLIKPMIFQNQVIFGNSQGLLTFVHEDEVIKELDEEFKDDPDFYRGYFDYFTFYDSAFTAEILLIQEDSLKTWFTADQKLAYYDKKNKQFINRPFWGINYGRINQFYLEDDGVLWVGCTDGLIRYKENKRKKYNTSFSSLIRKVVIDNDSTIFYGGNYQDSNHIPVIKYIFNDVKFNFSAPYFEDEHRPEYSYMLEGKDEIWTNWSQNNSANYTNLHEGDYTFKVKAKNIYNQISRETFFKFTILPPWYRTFFAYTVYVLIFLFLIFLSIKISSKRLKTKNEQLEAIVVERTKEISEKNKDLEFKNEMISEQKREIEDSINYAKRIQDAILPLKEEMRKHLPKSFVLFKPKDIVSGDFYWFSKHNNKLIIVCADCTGHGVPGAFMSMIGSDRLNIIVNERHETSPGQILSNLNQAIKTTLKQEGDNKDSTKDGMDAAICTVDLDTNQLIYAGANRPLWIINNGELEEIKATKVAVAGFTPDNQVYDEHIINLKSGLKFYMSSDGYADQFGGIKGKKYKVKAMKNFILNIFNKPYKEQSDALNKEIYNWMHAGEIPLEQVDDICVIGFEV